MITTAIRRKLDDFQQENLNLYRLLLAIAVLALPILLIFSPLPGYLMVASEHVAAKPIAACFFIALAVTETACYLWLWPRKELLYAIYIQGRFNMVLRHSLAFMLSRCLYPVFVFAALMKVPIDLVFVVYVVLCYLILLTIFWLGLMMKLRPVEFALTNYTAMRLKVFYILTKNGVTVRMVLALAVTLFCFSLHRSEISNSVLPIFLATLNLTLLFLFRSSHSVVLKNIDINKRFLVYIAPQMPQNYKKFSQASFGIMSLLAISANVIALLNR